MFKQFYFKNTHGDKFGQDFSLGFLDGRLYNDLAVTHDAPFPKMFLAHPNTVMITSLGPNLTVPCIIHEYV